MKRNLLQALTLTVVVILNSCSAPNQLTELKNAANNDDVYYTKAKAGDQVEYLADAGNQNGYRADNDYYYYGDYATRINRFANFSPFDYDDDFYYTYVPYNNGFGAGLDYNADYSGYNYGHANNLAAGTYSPYIYSPYDYGYSPYDMGGYDDFGYGAIYSAYIGGGGGGGYGGSYYRHHNAQSSGNTIASVGNNPNARGARTTQSPGVTRIAAYYPGNPMVNINANLSRSGVSANRGSNAVVSRQAGTNTYRPVQQNTTQPTYTPSSSSSSSSSAGGSSVSSGGGGGRPVRP